MLKIRINFVDDEKGNQELLKLVSDISSTHTILQQSGIYKGRGKSIYSSVYLDVEKGR